VALSGFCRKYKVTPRFACLRNIIVKSYGVLSERPFSAHPLRVGDIPQ
jgi:hypothetical protein